MKRLSIVLLVVICTLVVVAPASATTLTGVFTGGTGYTNAAPTVPVTLAVGGAVNIVVGAPKPVSGALSVSAPHVLPFPFGMPLRNWGTWTGIWAGGVYTADTILYAGDPLDQATTSWAMHLVAGGGVIHMTTEITNSPSGWDRWEFSGVLR